MLIDKVILLAVPQREYIWQTLEYQIKQQNWNYQRFLAGLANYTGPYKLDYIDDLEGNIDNFILSGANKRACYNCFKCHQKIIEIAKNENRQNVLMLECDAYLRRNFNAVLNSISSYFDKTNWHTIHLGWHIGKEFDTWNNNIEESFNKYGTVKVNKMIAGHGWHGTLVNHTFFDMILNMKPIAPLDVQMNWLYPKINSFYILPKIIHTKECYSPCSNSVIKRRNLQ